MSGFVGRVGALAVALGVGLAAVSAPGVAVADTGDGETGTGSADTGPGRPSPTNTDTADTRPDPSRPGTHTRDAAATVNDADTADDAASADDEPPEAPGDEDLEGDPENGDGVTGDVEPAVGGAASGVEGDDEGPLPVTEPGADGSVTPPPAVTPDPVVAAPVPGKRAANRDTTAAGTSPVLAVSPDVPATAAESSDTPAVADLTPVDLSAAAQFAPSSVQPQVLAEPAPSTSDSFSTAALDSRLTQADSTLADAVPIVHTLLSALLAPMLAPGGPAAPAQTPVLWTVLAWVRRQVETTLQLEAPVLVNSNAVTTANDALAASLIEPAAAQAAAASTYPAVVAEIFVSGTDVAISPDGTRAYVTVYPDEVVVIDTSTNTVVGSPIPVGRDPRGVVVSANGARVYVANADDDTVSVINTITNTVEGDPIQVGDGPEDLAISRDGSRVYVGNSADGTVTVIDTATNTVVGDPILVNNTRDWNTLDVAVSPDGSRLYVTHVTDPDLDGYVSVIDTATNTVIGDPIPTGLRLQGGIAVSPNGDRVYVSGYAGDGNTAALSVIDTASNSVIGEPLVLTGAENPRGVVVSPDGQKVYVAITKGPDIGGFAVINTATNAIIGLVEVHGGARELAVTPNGTRVYTADPIYVLVNAVDPTVTSPWTDDPGGGDPGGGDPGGEDPGEDPGDDPGEEPGTDWEDIENVAEDFAFWTGFIPGVGTFVNGLSLVFDVGQAFDAWNRRDGDDLADEIGDITNDVIGLIPFGRPLSKTNQVIDNAVKNVAGEVAKWIVDIWP